MLVVHQRHRAHSEKTRGQDLRVRVVADGQIETATARPAHEPRGPPEETARLAGELPAAVSAHDRGREPGGLRQLDRLRELPRRRLDLVPAPSKLRRQRAEEGHVRRVSKVNPDAHEAVASSQ